MKTYAEIQTALRCCVIGPVMPYLSCGRCPYNEEKHCSEELQKDLQEMLRTTHSENIRLKAALEGKNV